MATPNTKGIVLRGEDKTIQAQASKHNLPVRVDDGYEIPFAKTLFVEAGTRIPWDLLPAAWHFLERWDAAVPLWTYGELAEDQGTAAERKATKEVVRDLRVMLHAVELVFVQRNGACQALMCAWQEEMEGATDERLAFLRAMCRVKPMLCVLPVTWLATVRSSSHQALARGRGMSRNAGKPLVRVQLEPGRYVKCHEGDEEKVLAHFERQAGRG